MTRLAVIVSFVILLVFFPVQSQNPSPTQAPQTSQVSPASPEMTPRESAEMRADILMARKMYPEAIAAYGKLLEAEPHNAVLLNKIGIAYQEEGDSSRAGRYYKLACKANPTYARAFNNLGTIEYEKKRYGKAAGLYKRALGLPSDESTNATVYSNLGYCYFAQKHYDNAMDSFRKALALDSHVFEHHSGFGSIVQQRAVTEPGKFYILMAKTYALAGDIEHCVHYLRMARDQGYKDFPATAKDPAFALMIKDPRVKELFENPRPPEDTPRL